MENSEIKLIIPCDETREQIKELAEKQGVSFDDAPQSNLDGELLCQVSTIAVMPLIGLIQLFLQYRTLQDERISIDYKGKTFHNVPMKKAPEFLQKLEKQEQG